MMPKPKIQRNELPVNSMPPVQIQYFIASHMLIAAESAISQLNKIDILKLSDDEKKALDTATRCVSSLKGVIENSMAATAEMAQEISQVLGGLASMAEKEGE